MSTTPETNPMSAPVGPREEQSYLLVLISGLATTALALVGVYVLDAKTDFHIMGWYANYILPVGAILVGVVASSGYGLASWFSGIKINRSLLWMVLVLQLAAYFAAQYIEFKGRHLIHLRDGTTVGFIEYFDAMARSFAWKQDNGSPGTPLGVWGYAFRGLEILGFAAGGLIVPLVLRKKPYCQACQRYMRTRQLGLAPASVPAKKVKKSDAAGLAAYEAEQQQAFDCGKQTIESLQQHAAGAKTADFQKMLAELKPGRKQTAKLSKRFSLQLVHCNRCYAGQFVVKQLLGQGKQLKQTDFSSTELHSEFTRSVCQ
ncbi:MAG: hypothetical protein ACLP2Y_02170 [Limisphaerales bacterium]